MTFNHLYVKKIINTYLGMKNACACLHDRSYFTDKVMFDHLKSEQTGCNSFQKNLKDTEHIF